MASDAPRLTAITAPRWLRSSFYAAGVAILALVVLLVIELVRGAPAANTSDSVNTGASSGTPADDAANARDNALQQAVVDAPVLFSYDYRTLDKNLNAARNVTTGAFTSKYEQVSVPAVKPLAAKYKVVVKATVSAFSVVNDTNPKQIKVLLFVNQTVTNLQLPAPRVDANRVVLTMAPVGKGWKVAGVDAI